MKRAIFRFAFVVATFIAATAILLAGGYQIGEHGARSMGMGGAFVAQARDASAIYFNPAGLTFLKGINVMVGTTLIAPSTEFTGPTPLTTKTKMESQVFYPSNAYVTYSMDNGLSLGVGFFNPFGLGTEWKALPTGFPGITFAMKSDLATYYFNPTVAYKLSDQFSIGAGFSYILGSLQIEMPSGTQTVKSDKATGNGIGFNFGLQYKPMPELTIGASYRSETKIDFEGDATVSGLPSPPLPFTSASGTAKATMPMPSTIMAGVAYDFSPDLTVEADFQYMGWKAYDKLAASVTLPVVGTMALDQTEDWKNSFLLRFGGEYRMDKLALRAGFIYDSTPQPDKAVSPQLPDANRLEFTAGFGYAINEMISVDAAYQFVKSSDRTVTAPENT